MPVALITLHAYRSWSEDNPRGYVQRGRPGVQPANPRMARARAARASGPPARFDGEQMKFLLDEARDIAGRRRWRVHAGSCTATHLHLIVSWRSEDIPEKDVRRVRMAHARRVGRGERGMAWGGAALPGGVSGPATREEEVEAVTWKLKELLGMRLSQRKGSVGNRWFSRGDHDRWVRDERHLMYLRTRYLPRHLRERGVVRDWDGEVGAG